jgi:hypothetical protein
MDSFCCSIYLQHKSRKYFSRKPMVYIFVVHILGWYSRLMFDLKYVEKNT